MNELRHHGIKGMKWGVRRYQNADGSLTDAGKRRAKLDKMTDDKLQKTLYKEVKRKRSEQSDWSNQWMVTNTIGPHSKAAQDRYDKAVRDHQNSDAYKQAMKKAKTLDRDLDRGKIDIDEYDKQWRELSKSIHRRDLEASVTYTSQGRKYSKAYLKKYGRDISIGYLKDLGYDDATAKKFVDRILRGAGKKTLYGL